MFYSHDHRGEIDIRSVHASCPSFHEKWIIQKFYHTGFTTPALDDNLVLFLPLSGGKPPSSNWKEGTHQVDIVRAICDPPCDAVNFATRGLIAPPSGGWVSYDGLTLMHMNKSGHRGLRVTDPIRFRSLLYQASPKMTIAFFFIIYVHEPSEDSEEYLFHFQDKRGFGEMYPVESFCVLDAQRRLRWCAFGMDAPRAASMQLVPGQLYHISILLDGGVAQLCIHWVTPHTS